MGFKWIYSRRTGSGADVAHVPGAAGLVPYSQSYPGKPTEALTRLLLSVGKHELKMKPHPHQRSAAQTQSSVISHPGPAAHFSSSLHLRSKFQAHSSWITSTDPLLPRRTRLLRLAQVQQHVLKVLRTRSLCEWRRWCRSSLQEGEPTLGCLDRIRVRGHLLSSHQRPQQ